MSGIVDVNSQWYPYSKVQEGYFDLKDAVQIPRKICDYIIDAPKGAYQPKDSEEYSRSRLWKYLYYDGEKPLEQPLPTISQKMSVLFNPEKPEEPPTQKGYRLIPQVYTKQSQENAQTRLYVYLGSTVPNNDENTISLSVVFTIFTHYTYEANMKTDEYSRAVAIEQALIEALHGVNMAGVGTFYFSKTKHPHCGSRVVYDGNTNVGREVTFGLEIATTVPNGTRDFEDMPYIGDGTLRLA